MSPEFGACLNVFLVGMCTTLCCMSLILKIPKIKITTVHALATSLKEGEKKILLEALKTVTWCFIAVLDKENKYSFEQVSSKLLFPNPWEMCRIISPVPPHFGQDLIIATNVLHVLKRQLEVVWSTLYFQKRYTVIYLKKNNICLFRDRRDLLGNNHGPNRLLITSSFLSIIPRTRVVVAELQLRWSLNSLNQKSIAISRMKNVRAE